MFSGERVTLDFEILDWRRVGDRIGFSPPVRICKRTQAYKRTEPRFMGAFSLPSVQQACKRTAKRASVPQWKGEAEPILELSCEFSTKRELCTWYLVAPGEFRPKTKSRWEEGGRVCLGV